MKISEAIQTLGQFCGPRDVPALHKAILQKQYGIPQADVFVLFGGSIPAGGDVLAKAMQSKTARFFGIVGGEGHTTAALRRKMHLAFPEIETEGQPEAVIFDRYLRHRYGLCADFLECRSTNCGNNITNLLELLSREKIQCRSIILAQDASMQRRMAAGMEKYRPDLTVINYAVYQAEVLEKDGVPFFSREIWGMWDMDRYLSLLIGEIDRLFDGPEGYGPRGKNYIAHVDIPEEVMEAARVIKAYNPRLGRAADNRYASQ